jgi:type II secretory pathway pseudopilin PulG
VKTWKLNAGASGFTILELLVSSVVLLIVLGIMLATLTTSLGLWRGTENRLSADREARAAELLMAQDLAGVVMGTNPNLWPRLNGVSLQLLTTKPTDYQIDPGDIGDVCFVEYTFVADPKDSAGQLLVRRFLGSAETYTQILSVGALPAVDTNNIGGITNGCPQILATNLLATMSNAVRGTKIQKDGEMSKENITILGTNMLKISGAYSPNNYPRAIEVNFAAANPDAISNADLLDNPNYRLRDAGVYSFRVLLPKPPGFP